MSRGDNAPSRFPKGIGYVLPNMAARNTGSYTFTAGDTTPDISESGFWVIHPTSSVTITGFDGGQLGRQFFVYSHSAGLVTIASGNNVILAAGLENPLLSTTSGAYISGTGAAPQLVMQSNQIVQFIFLDSSRCIQIGGQGSLTA